MPVWAFGSMSVMPVMAGAFVRRMLDISAPYWYRPLDNPNTIISLPSIQPGASGGPRTIGPRGCRGHELEEGVYIPPVLGKCNHLHIAQTIIIVPSISRCVRCRADSRPLGGRRP